MQCSTWRTGRMMHRCLTTAALTRQMRHVTSSSSSSTSTSTSSSDASVRLREAPGTDSRHADHDASADRHALTAQVTGGARTVATQAAPQTDALGRTAGASTSAPPRRGAAGGGSVGTPGKVKRARATEIKVKKKAPWGVQQLRDSWSEDAMSKRETENMSERIHREYRYHPDEQWRQWLKITAVLTIPCVLMGAALSYYVNTGKGFWHADPQHLLNLIRAPDMSPRSKLYPYRLEETYELPRHVLEHRAAFHDTRVLRDRIFTVTHSAFTCLTPEVQRQLDAQAEADAAG